LRWEQRTLPGLAARTNADLIHVAGGGPALLGSIRTLFSPADFSGEVMLAQERGARPGFASRLSQAFAQGGMMRTKSLLWPNDLPQPEVQAPVHLLPPAVHPIFQPEPSTPGSSQPFVDQLSALNLPETYLLYHGLGNEQTLRRLLDAWSWAAGPIGEYYPLVLAGLDRPAQDRLAALLAEYQLTGTARALPPLSLTALAGVYRGCSGLFHPAESSPWGDPIRMALACSKPVVGLETARSAALAGPAGYLISVNQPYPAICRALGAALITVIVEASLTDELSQAARERSASWQFDLFAHGLWDCYQRD
jgi:glycosyltransferase involved in cell wall biosynthesis